MAFQDTLEKRAEKMFQSVFGWEQKALIRIGKRVKSIGSLSFADLQAINNYAQYRGMSEEDFFKKYAEDLAKIDADAVMEDLAKLTGQNVRETRHIYADVIDQQHEGYKQLYDYRNKPYVPLAENKELQALVDAYSRTTAETFVNFSMTKANAIGFMQNKTFVPLQKSFTDVLSKAVVSVATGTGTFGAEMRDVLRELGGSGVRVDYGNGDTRSLDSMVRQNLLWGAKRASREYSRLIGEELGCDGIEIDWHSNPRPFHVFMQGKQFVLGKARVINGIFFESADKALEALNDYGCLHFETYIICGVSEPAYDPEELERLNQQNAQPITIDGVTKTGYEWKQTMRRLERAGRQTKLQREVLKASGDNIGADEAERTLKAIRKKEKRIMDKYQKIADRTGIKAQPEKMSFVKGKDSALPNVGKVVDNSGKSGIIKIDSEEYMRAQFPKGFRNETNPGKTITADNLEYFYNKATEYGVRFDTRLGKYGGFETYRGNIDVLDDALERIKTNRAEMQKHLKDDVVLLKYDDIKDDNGAIDIETFAMVKGHTITLNKFMYDDTEYLKQQYADSVRKRMFTEGTDYGNIIDHEMGHIFEKSNDYLRTRAIYVIEKMAKEKNLSVRDFIYQNISEYAQAGGELIAELNAMRKGANPQLAKSIWEEISK
ncbi:MAG: hypothetical protein IJ285_00870 [Clostridia bacterium]|nr:hypothetical protein [Clostridia bacterium]